MSSSQFFQNVDWGAIATGASGALAVACAVWLGKRQINIAARQIFISEDQVNISKAQIKIAERQTNIMEAQANLEQFHAMRDDLSTMLTVEEFLLNIKHDLIAEN